MDNSTLYDEKMKDPEFARLMAEETLILEFTEKIIDLMERKGISKVQLAERLRKSKGFITQLLNGNRNFTLRTIADVFYALGYDLKIQEEDQIDQKQCSIMVIEKFLDFPKKLNYQIPQNEPYPDHEGLLIEAA